MKYKNTNKNNGLKIIVEILKDKNILTSEDITLKENERNNK